MNNNREYCKNIAENNDEYIFLTNVCDKFSTTISKNIETRTNFLTEREQTLCILLFAKLKFKGYEFDGGYDEATRKICYLLPSYDTNKNSLAFISIIKSKRDVLSHKDYLGSLMGLNIKREMIGDIIVTENGADLVVVSEIKNFILVQYNKVGKKTIYTLEITRDKLSVGTDDYTEICDTISSLRFDLIVATSFKISRANAKDEILHGRVLLNGFICNKPDKELVISDILSIRGKGKAKFIEALYTTKKGKIRVIIKKY